MPETAGELRSQISARFEANNGRTGATLDSASAPLELRGPFVRAGASAFYLRNVSCGIFAGDRYDVRLTAAAGTHAVVRSTSATAVHAMPSGHACARTVLDAAPGAFLAYVDGPLILQCDADFRQRTELVIRPGTIVAYAEILVLGRLARGELLRFRRFDSEIVVRDADGAVRFVERYSLVADATCDSILDAGAPIVASLLVAGVESSPDEYWSHLELDGDRYVAGYDTLPGRADIVMRAAGSRLEPISRLLDAALAAVSGTPAAQPVHT